MSRKQDLLRLFARLTPAQQDSLVDYAAFLAARGRVHVQPAPMPKPQNESVVEAIRRLNHTYPMLERHTLMPRVEALLAAHMVDNRPVAEVIEQLERYYAEQFQSSRGP